METKYIADRAIFNVRTLKHKDRYTGKHTYIYLAISSRSLICNSINNDKRIEQAFVRQASIDTYALTRCRSLRQ